MRKCKDAPDPQGAGSASNAWMRSKVNFGRDQKFTRDFGKNSAWTVLKMVISVRCLRLFQHGEVVAGTMVTNDTIA